MARVGRCRRSTLLAAAAGLAVLLPLAGCGSAGSSSAERTLGPSTATSATTSTASSPAAERPPALPRAVDPVVVGHAHRSPAVLPELADLPHALGHEVHLAGRAVALPRGAEHLWLVPVAHGLLVSTLIQPGEHCRTYFFAADGRLLELRDACEATTVNPAGTLVTGRYLGLGESPTRYAVYALPSGRLTAISPAVPGLGPRDATFDGDELVLENPQHPTVQSRWNPATGALTDEPRPQRTTSPQELTLIDEEWGPVPSPDGTLSVLVDSAQQLVGVWRTATEQFLVHHDAVPGVITGSVWLDSDQVLLTVTSSSGRSARLATLRVSTGRVAWSASVPGALVVAAARPGPTSG